MGFWCSFNLRCKTLGLFNHFRARKKNRPYLSIESWLVKNGILMSWFIMCIIIPILNWVGCHPLFLPNQPFVPFFQDAHLVSSNLVMSKATRNPTRNPDAGFRLPSTFAEGVDLGCFCPDVCEVRCVLRMLHCCCSLLPRSWVWNACQVRELTGELSKDLSLDRLDGFKNHHGMVGCQCVLLHFHQVCLCDQVFKKLSSDSKLVD